MGGGDSAAAVITDSKENPSILTFGFRILTFAFTNGSKRYPRDERLSDPQKFLKMARRYFRTEWKAP